MKEIWKDIPNHPGYQVSSWGRVKSFKRHQWRILKEWKVGKNYRQISIGKRARHTVHRLVLLAFVGPCPDGKQCRHLDGNPTNNSLNNLCWGTPKEDWDDKRKHGTVRVLQGEECSYSKLTERNIRRIRKLYKAGIYTQKQLAEKYKIHQVTVSEIILKKIWKHIN